MAAFCTHKIAYIIHIRFRHGKRRAWDTSGAAEIWELDVLNTIGANKNISKQHHKLIAINYNTYMAKIPCAKVAMYDAVAREIGHDIGKLRDDIRHVIGDKGSLKIVGAKV